MHFSTLATVALSALASAKIIPVSIGKNGNNTIEPADITAKVGDDIDFVFLTGDHGLSSADFPTPCQPSAQGGFWTGFQNVTTNGVRTFRLHVNNTDPIWFYCASRNHCQLGMVGVINAPDGKTLDDFKKAATTAPNSTHPASAFGGIIVKTSNSTDLPTGKTNSTAPARTSSATKVSSATPTHTGGSSTGAAKGNGTSPAVPGGASSLGGGMAGVVFAAVGMAVALIA